jgi:peptidoglycan/LPS O-acetylase OafA/YrhL
VSEKLGYRPALDGFRALAIVPVVALHAFGWPQEGALGVDIFFVLSGFLITVLLLEERVALGRISLRGFWRRRVARLVPGLLVMLVIYSVAARGSHSWAVVFGASYTTNIANLVDTNVIPWSLGHLWSLSQEEQFYLLWPPLLLLILRFRPAMLGRILGLMVFAVFIEKVVLLSMGAGLERLYFAPDTHSDPIIVGCLFGSLFAGGAALPITRRPRQLVAALAITVMAGMILLPGRVSPFTPTSVLRMIFPFACGILVLATLEGCWVTRALSTTPFVFLGRISYSLYLWHVPILAAAGAAAYDHRHLRSALALGAAVAVATASFYCVERPLRQRLRHPRPREGALTPIAVPIK